MTVRTGQLDQVPAEDIGRFVLKQREGIIGVCDFVAGVANIGDGGEESSDVRFGREGARADPREAAVKGSLCSVRSFSSTSFSWSTADESAALTEEAPFQPVQRGHLRICADYHWTLGIPSKLSVDGSQWSDEPIVVLEEAVGCGRLRAGEIT